MDLLLISLEPLDLFPSSSTAPNHQQHQQQKQQSDRTISPEKVKAQKVALGLLVANNTATALNHSSAGRSSQIMVRSDAWQVLKDNCLDKHISTYTASSKGKSSGRMQSNAPVGKV